jgi:hypothetical protein
MSESKSPSNKLKGWLSFKKTKGSLIQQIDDVPRASFRLEDFPRAGRSPSPVLLPEPQPNIQVSPPILNRNQQEKGPTQPELVEQLAPEVLPEQGDAEEVPVEYYEIQDHQINNWRLKVGMVLSLFLKM